MITKQIVNRKGEVFDVMFDECDLQHYISNSWCIAFMSAKRARPTVYCATLKTHFSRLVMSAPKGLVVDHINGNPLDNRRVNLRLCTQAENTRNRVANRNSSSTYRGVTKRENGKWAASICSKYVGYFDSEWEAALAYNYAALSLFGKYARLNVRK